MGIVPICTEERTTDCEPVVSTTGLLMSDEQPVGTDGEDQLCCYGPLDSKFQAPERACPPIFDPKTTLVCEKPPHHYQENYRAPYNKCRHSSFREVRTILLREFGRSIVNRIMPIENDNPPSIYPDPKNPDKPDGVQFHRLNWDEKMLLSSNPAHRAKANVDKVHRPDPRRVQAKMDDLDKHIDRGLYVSAYVRTTRNGGIHVVTIFGREDRVIDGKAQTVYLFTDPGDSNPKVYEFVWNEEIGTLVKYGNPFAKYVKEVPYIFMSFIPYLDVYLKYKDKEPRISSR